MRVDANRVTARLGSEVVGDHARSYARHRSVTEPRHVRLREELRRPAPKAIEDEVEIRDLSVYDRIGAA